MAEGNQISVTVRTRPGVEHRARGGHSFSKVPKTVLVTAENLELIKDDPRLTIVADGKPEAKEPEPSSAPTAAKQSSQPRQKK